MATRAELYEQHANACVLAAGRTANPKHREMLVKMARQWTQGAQLNPGDSKHERVVSPPPTP
jgi:hypothetical protein